MGIFSRMADIVNSNINALLDHAEEPEKMIRLMIQEMEDTLVEVRADAAKMIAEKKDISRRLSKMEDAEQEWDQRASLALEREREDLAKAALIEKQKLKVTVDALQDDIQILDENLERLDGDIAQLQDKLTEAKTKKQTMETRHSAASTSMKARQSLYDGRVDDALARFDQMEKKLDEAESRVEVYDMGQSRSLADEIADLEVEAAIEEELAQLKERVKKADTTSED